MKALRLKALALLCLTALPGVAGAATEVAFDQGSLIIPMQRAYQDDCGAVAAYGLVYNLLRNNITVYWAVEPTKQSHHRCVNNKVPYSSTVSMTSNKLTDGCDMVVAKNDGIPVSLFNNTSGLFVDSGWKTTSTKSTAVPSTLGEDSITMSSAQQFLRYMGGPFIIDATQAAAALNLIQTNSDFKPYRDASATCYDNKGAPQFGSAFHVNLHRANNSFKAPIARVMNETPRPIALVKGYNSFIPDSAPGVEVLVKYLHNSGLDLIPNAQCPNASGNCPTSNGHGVIFDVLDQAKGDLTTKLNAPDKDNPNQSFYQVMWAPHWDPNTSVSAGVLQDQITSIVRFVDNGNSIFSECGSIGLYEGSAKATKNADYSLNFTSSENTGSRFFTGQNSTPGLTTTTNNLSVFSTPSGNGTSFAPTGLDCSDAVGTEDCYTYSNYSDLFSQKGDYQLVAGYGTVEAFKPRSGGYPTGTSQMWSTRSTNGQTNGWDLFISQQKDNNRQKGKILYLGGHTFAGITAGNRLVLNTLLNLSFRAVKQEFSRSEPVSDIVYKKDSTGTVLKDSSGQPLVDTMNVLSGTFMYVAPQALFPERQSFTVTKAADWVFPYIQGNFRSIPSSAIGTKVQAFSQFNLLDNWNADEVLPAPNTRRVFTVLGDNQKGLKQVKFVKEQVVKATCLDSSSTGSVDGACDLEEALNLDTVVPVGLTPLDLDKDGKVDPMTADQKAKNALWNQHFVQRVLGYCVAEDNGGTNFTPSSSNCDNREVGEVIAHLGGLDHASAAIVGASRYITTTRPDMAYIGGLDGQLHAIYLRGTVGTFDSNYVSGRATPKLGEELWSFIPQGQLSRLSTNYARVDMSPVVADVLVDYDWAAGIANGTIPVTGRHTGKFFWRTVLVGGAGRLGGELFALDVTDALHPIVLWDVTSGSYNTSSTQNPVNTATTWIDNGTNPATYNVTPPPDKLTNAYDYRNMGDALSMNLVPVRRGNRPTFQVIFSTNGANGTDRQLNVFALDAGSGEKFWEWQRLYNGTSTAPNSVPGGTSTLDVDGDGNMDRVYVGDMDGRLWELSALSGVNLNYFQYGTSTSRTSYPLFNINTPYQPITTVPAIMRLPYTLPTDTYPGMSRSVAGRLALVFGTAGADWVVSGAPTTQGRVYVLATQREDTVVRSKTTFDTTGVTAEQKADMLNKGTTKQPDAVSYLQLDVGERVVGAPKAVGSTVVLTTAYGNTDTDSRLQSGTQGRTHLVDLSKSTGSDAILSDNVKSAAGSLIMPNGAVVTQSVMGLVQTAPNTVNKGTPLAGKRTQAHVGSWLDTGRVLSE